MAAGKHGSSEVTVSVEDGPGGSAQVITDYVRAINGIEVEAITQPSHAFGDSWEEHTPTGMQRLPDIVLTMYYDDTATTGPAVVFAAIDNGPQDDGRELIIGYGNSKTTTVDVRLAKVRRLPSLGELTGMEVTLRPTGTAVEA